MDRRSFLKLSAVSTLVGTGCATSLSAPMRAATRERFDASNHERPLTSREVAALDEHHAAFPLGVMAGDATASSAVVWTRCTGAPFVTLWLREIGSDVVMQREVPVGVDGFTHIDIDGLRPDARYRYAFLIRERAAIAYRGPSGRFRTPPSADALRPITFAGTSCTNQFIRPYPAMAHAASRGDLDFFVHAGDHVYADLSHSLDDFRAPYALAWPSYGMKGLHASVGSYATWDDHEVGNNWDPETWDRARIANARRAFFEHHPLRRDERDPERIWRSVRWGKALELFVLDCRGERRPSTRLRNDATYLSRTQMDWLKRGLATSDARFKAIVNSVPITNFPGVFDWVGNDRWEGYPAARDEILSFIANERIDGVWWLSGDFHFGAIARVEATGPYAAQREVLMGPGRQHANPFWSDLRGDQWEFVTGTNNYTVFRADPVRDTMEVIIVGPSGEVLVRRGYRRDARAA